MPDVKETVAESDAVCEEISFNASPNPLLTLLKTPEPLLTHNVFPPASLTVFTLTESVATIVSPEAPSVSVLPAGSIALTLSVVTR